MTEFSALAPFDDVFCITPKRHADPRGYLSETYRSDMFGAHGIHVDFVQDNQSLSSQVGTVRGLHFQAPPHAQAKLVRCLVGEIYDVVVDVRRGSPTFGKWAGAELTAGSGRQLYVPAGYAHGFCTLAPDTLVHYKMTAHYVPSAEAGILWNDPALGIDWPVKDGAVHLSEKDEILPVLAGLTTPFVYASAPVSERLS